MDRTDAQLIDASRHGDDTALPSLIRRYLGQVHGFVRRVVGDDDDAQDVTQEAFVKIWKNLDIFDERKKFLPWALTIAKRTSLDFLKKKKTIPFSRFDGDDGLNAIEDSIPDTAPLPPEILDRKDADLLLLAALEKLSPASQEILTLHHREDLTFEEIAEVMEEPMNTVKSRYRRAILLLRTILGGRND